MNRTVTHRVSRLVAVPLVSFGVLAGGTLAAAGLANAAPPPYQPHGVVGPLTPGPPPLPTHPSAPLPPPAPLWR